MGYVNFSQYDYENICQYVYENIIIVYFKLTLQIHSFNPISTASYVSHRTWCNTSCSYSDQVRELSQKQDNLSLKCKMKMVH